MKNEKYVFFSLIILIGILSISFASANENIILNENTQSNIEELSLDSSNENLILNENNDNTFIDCSNENLILDEKDDSTFIDSTEKTKLSDSNTYSFTKLNEAINSGNTVINLTDNYKYSDGDEAFLYGIVINNSITINGNGITIDGSNTARIFNITADNVIINNIIFTNGKACVGNPDEDACGGAILWNGANGILNNSTFNNNTAEDGGAVDWYGYNGTISNSTFNNNTSNNEGGAIKWQGTSGAVNNSTFNNNTAVNGGAIHWTGANGTLNNSIFNNNTARMFGGAIRWEGANGNISNSTFNNNNATEYGGALRLSGTNDTISNSTFNNNNAGRDGGAILCPGESCAIINSTFTNNKARNGGAIDWGGEYGNVTSCLFVNNTATTNGSVYYNGYSRKSFSNFTNNILLNNSPDEIYYEVFNGSNADYNWFGNNASEYDRKPYDQSNTWLFINGTADPEIIIVSDISEIVFKLYAYDGNEISEYDNSALYPINLSLSSTKGTISDETVGLNEKTTFQADSMGNVQVSAKVEDAQTYITITITDVGNFCDLNRTINGNDYTEITLNKNYTYNPETDSAFIHGIIINRTVTINGNNNTINGLDTARFFHILADNVIINNIIFTNGNGSGDTGARQNGGAIYWNGKNGTVKNSIFNNNYAQNNAGAIYWNSIYGIVRNSTFNNNTADVYGGAIYWNANNGAVINSTFNNNTADVYGGAIRWYGNNGTVSNSTFNNNTAQDTGGAIRWTGNDGALLNSIFNNNKANIGGAIRWNGKNSTVSNSTFNNNKATEQGGAIFWTDNYGTVSNSTFNNNTAETEGGAILWYGDYGTVSNSTFNDNTAGYYGGAIYWFDIEGAVSNSTFNNNTAKVGGAIHWSSRYGNVSSCLFINNTATNKGSVYYNNQENNHCNFTNNILLNNNPEEIYYYAFEGSNADYNWFGNNASDYNQKPYNQSKIWLFINGTADPEQIPALSTSNIIFKLYAYDEATGEIIEFNDLIYPITLSLSSIYGNLSKNSAGLGENIIYSSESYGLGSVTASIENTKSTITIENIPEEAELEVSIGNNVINYGENATIILEFNEIATGTVNITLTGKEYERNITNEEIKETILISGLNPDEYTITVSYSGDNRFHPEIKTASTTLTVNKVTPTVNVQDATTEWNVSVSIPVSVEGVEGYPITGTVIVTVSWAEDDKSKVFDLEDGIESVTFKIDETVGECTITVRYVGDENYNEANATATLTITESTELNVEVTDNSPTEGQDIIITVTATDGRGTEVPITKANISIDGDEPTEIELDENGNANIGKLPEGPHTITISVNDGVHQEKTITKEIVVNPPEAIPTEIVVTVENISYGAKPVIEFTFKDMSDNPLSGTLNVTVADKQYPVTIGADGKGTLTIQDILPADTYPVVANFAGNKTHEGAISTGYFNIAKNATIIIFENMQTKAVDPKADGRIGEWFYFTLKDVNGNPIANTPMEIGFNGVVYTYEKDGICTDENGIAKLQINLGYKGDYTFAICYLGNQSYNASFVVAKITVNCQTPTLTVPNKSYAASAKTKTLTATFKNEHGKLIADKQISFTVNGKTYKAKTNSKGVASVNVRLNKKGTYTVVAKYAGASTYNAVSKKAKLTIK